MNSKYISRKNRRKSLNKIFVSKAEIKHTNNKAIITIFVYNRERLALLKRIKSFEIILFKTKRKIIRKFNYALLKCLLPFFFIFHLRKINLRYQAQNTTENKVINKLTYFRQELKNIEFSEKYIYRKLSKLLLLIRRYKLKLNLNKHKFQEFFLYKLGKFISKFYDKKIEFNIIKLRSLAYNKDIFLQILATKLKKDRANSMHIMNSLLSKINIPEFNTIIERANVKKKNLNLIDNKFNSITLNTILNNNENNLNSLLFNAYCNNISYNNILFPFQNKDDNSLLQYEFLSSNELYNERNNNIIRNTILYYIKYKNMGGARLRVKGRLTKRYRADRAIYKLKWKGGLKNIDSSFKGLPSVIFRGYLKSNIEYSIATSKRRIGSFAAKGWFSGK